MASITILASLVWACVLLYIGGVDADCHMTYDEFQWSSASCSKLYINMGQRKELPGAPFSARMSKIRAKEIHITNSGLSKLPGSFLERKGPLDHVNMSHNQIQDIAQFVLFAGNPVNVSTLDLSYNKIGYIAQHAFAKYRCNILRLNNNQIKLLPEDLFGFITDNKFTSTFSTIDLSHNLLRTLPAKIFQQVNIAHLNLANNLLTSLPATLFSQLQLNRLDLSFNSLTTLPATIFVFASIHNINLAHNSLTTLPAKIFARGNITHLDLSHNSLTTLPATIFSQRTNAGVYKSIFSQVRRDKSTSTLDLSHNSLTTLPASIFSRVVTKNLLLNNNKIKWLPANLFGTAKDPHVAIVSGRKITSIHGTLNLSHNSLTSLPTTIFSQVQINYDLDLSHNSLTTLPATIFELGYITSVLLNNNQIKWLPADLLITSRPSWSIIGIRVVHPKFNLSHNSLTTLPATIFSQVKITILNLDHNSLTFLPDAIFSQAKISELNLNNNLLTALPSSIGSLKQRDPYFALTAVNSTFTLTASICSWGSSKPALTPLSSRIILAKAISTSCTEERMQPNLCMYSYGSKSLKCPGVHGCPFGACPSPQSRCVPYASTGYFCEDVCNGNPCPHPGMKCVSANGKHTCLCRDGFSGTNCDKRIPLSHGCSKTHLIFPKGYYASSSAPGITAAYVACLLQGMKFPEDNDLGCVQGVATNPALGPNFAKPPNAGILMLMMKRKYPEKWQIVHNNGFTSAAEPMLARGEKPVFRVVCVKKS